MRFIITKSQLCSSACISRLQGTEVRSSHLFFHVLCFRVSHITISSCVDAHRSDIPVVQIWISSHTELLVTCRHPPLVIAPRRVHTLGCCGVLHLICRNSIQWNLTSFLFSFLNPFSYWGENNTVLVSLSWKCTTYKVIFEWYHIYQQMNIAPGHCGGRTACMMG